MSRRDVLGAENVGGRTEVPLSSKGRVKIRVGLAMAKKSPGT